MEDPVERQRKIAEIKGKSKELDEELKRLEEEEKKFEASKPVYKIAELLHSMMCHYNHTDMCDWCYDQGAWTASSRMEYLSKARKIIQECAKNGIPEEQVLTVVQIWAKV